ncbi:type II toxin-antitoxin system RelE family toxin [Arvimicrobium flavum]|uniref:type II toxin-antitoxin system RelE family toxin n=1 Tax=Arvimicrobium flavum TaxID=3393320 RepID=UPI00237AEEF0|nr:type II toxin-antitoxin system RelE/ParE family toxin [Mesorhizobium shangrilense]
MAWTVEYSEAAKRILKKLDRQTSLRILNFLDKRVVRAQDPRSFGHSLKGKLREYWRYRVGDYRIICHLQDDRLVVLVLDIGNRRDVYR